MPFCHRDCSEYQGGPEECCFHLMVVGQLNCLAFDKVWFLFFELLTIK